MKLGVGTVQFGTNYGISNTDGQTSAEEASRILSVAESFGIQVLDTAALYGSSEEVLGQILHEGHNFKLVTKTIRVDCGHITKGDAHRLEETFRSSLAKLRSSAVYGLMFHNADDLLAHGGEMLMECMRAQQQKGLVRKIGASVYTAEQIDRILERFDIDLVQLPMNVLDQRLLADGRLAALKSRGVEIHVRSAFLQGLLLMDPATLPEHFNPVRELLVDYHNLLEKNNITPVQAALGFLAACSEIDVIVCGVNNHVQLNELCLMAEPLQDIDFSVFAINDETIINPSKWQLNS